MSPTAVTDIDRDNQSGARAARRLETEGGTQWFALAARWAVKLGATRLHLAYSIGLSTLKVLAHDPESMIRYCCTFPTCSPYCRG